MDKTCWLPDAIFIPGLEKLLLDKNISGFKTSEYHKPRWRVYGADLELYMGSALARSGSKNGLKILIVFLDEIHSNFRGFAQKELKAITGKDYGFSKSGWTNYLNSFFVYYSLNLI